MYLNAHLSVDDMCYLTTPDLFSQGVTFIKYYSNLAAMVPKLKGAWQWEDREHLARKEKG